MSQTSVQPIQTTCFIVTVVIDVLPAHVREFHVAIQKNAEFTRFKEPGCLQFDVGVSPQNPGKFFLYELYRSKSDFEWHLGTAHFAQFDHLVGPWIVNKTVQTFDLLTP